MIPANHSDQARIVHIDDEPRTGLVLGSLLRHENYDFINFSNSENALRFLSDPRERVDLIISDVRQCPVDGIQFYRQSLQIRPHQVLIYLSSRGSPEIVQTAFELGAYEFVHKPFNDEAFLKIVDRALNASRSAVVEYEALPQLRLGRIGGRPHGQIGDRP